VILVKGREVRLGLVGGRVIVLPESHGIIHDPDGFQLPYCDCYFGPYEVVGGPPPKLSRAAKAYFGRGYHGARAGVDIPTDVEWSRIGDMDRIWYRRRGSDRRLFVHKFKRPVPVYNRGDWYRADLGDSCVADARGFVVP
jgi:hypothetical protein